MQTIKDPLSSNILKYDSKTAVQEMAKLDPSFPQFCFRTICNKIILTVDSVDDLIYNLHHNR